LINYQNIKLRYEGRTIFDDFSLEINRNEHICLAGPSGRGKTTLLKMLPALVLPDSGEVVINNIRLNEQNVRNIRKLITWIPQNINLPVNTAAELMALLNLNDKKTDISVNINRLGLDDSYFEKHFADISGGEKQRIVIAVSLAKDKPIIVMDEPTSALDSRSIELLCEIIAEQNERTIISASHNEQWLKQSPKVLRL